MIDVYNQIDFYMLLQVILFFFIIAECIIGVLPMLKKHISKYTLQVAVVLFNTYMPLLSCGEQTLIFFMSVPKIRPF